MPLDPASYNLAKKAYKLGKANQRDIQGIYPSIQGIESDIRDIRSNIQRIDSDVQSIKNNWPPPFKPYVSCAIIPLGFNGQYPTQGVGRTFTRNNVILDISILFQLQPGETQTVQLTFLFFEGSIGTIEISASSTEGTVVEKRLSNYHYYIAMGGPYPPPSQIFTVVGPKSIFNIVVKAKTNLSSGSTAPIIFIRHGLIAG
jgi:hypothetical protein